MRPIPAPRRLVPLTAVVAVAAAALGGAFGLGVAFGRGQRAAPRPSVVDQAAALIRAKADQPAPGLDAAAIRGMLAGLDDRWASYYGVGTDAGSADALQALLDGRYSGLGVWLRRSGEDDRQVLVASVTGGSPAAAAGVHVGDQIESIDGQSMLGADMDVVADALRGPRGSLVTVGVGRPGERTRLVRLRRVDLPGTTVSTDLLAPGVERIRIATFSQGVGAAVAAAVARARVSGVHALVLDLRGNPGGLLDEAVRCASVFLDGGPVVSLRGRSVPQTTLDATRGGNTATPLAVLVDGGTASAAEVLAGALHDRGRAVLVGSRTFGKGSVQQTTRLSDGSVLEFTVATYRTPDGDAVDKVGIAPDVQVDPQDAPDVASDRAVALLAGLTTAGG